MKRDNVSWLAFYTSYSEKIIELLPRCWNFHGKLGIFPTIKWQDPAKRRDTGYSRNAVMCVKMKNLTGVCISRVKCFMNVSNKNSFPCYIRSSETAKFAYLHALYAFTRILTILRSKDLTLFIDRVNVSTSQRSESDKSISSLTPGTVSSNTH